MKNTNKYFVMIAALNLVWLGNQTCMKKINKHFDSAPELKKELKEHKLTINSIVFSSDGKQLVTGSWDNTIKVWDVKSGKSINRTSPNN